MKPTTINSVTMIAAFLFAVNVHAQKELPEGVSSDWYAQSSTAIEAMQYSFSPSGKTQSFKVINPKNYLQFHINPAGYSISNMIRNEQEKKWNATFSFMGMSKNKLNYLTNNNFIIASNKSSLIYKSTSLDIEYVNNSRGLRQNFIINQKPSGTEKLALKIQIESDLSAKETSTNNLILFDKKNEKDVKLIYDELKVWDANNNALSAEMKVNPSTKIITITVDDKNAVYPITIDPLNRTPEWGTSADGILPGLLTNLQLQVGTMYGFTVAGLGDINGDGYDDVSVSAPTMADVITGSGSLVGVGAVFIYLGSPTGLSATPNKVLQPTTAVSGALFGFSIDAGDITGDGKNDIVISAPLDRYQTSAAGLLGPTTVDVTAGKVYLYRSEDLFTAPNPTPFLEIRLQGTAFFSTGIAGLLGSNVTANPLFGYSVAVTNDLNGDNKADIVIGAPAYLGIDLLSVQSGNAFVYYSDNLSTTAPVKLNTPTPTLLGLLSLPIANTSGLLFGQSVDGVGDFNNDGFQDVAVGAPAGADLSSLGGIFTGQFLGGSAYVFYGTGSGINNTSTVKLQADASGLLSNAANLFGYKVKGVKNAFGVKTGSILIGSPAGAVLSNVVGGLELKAGQVHLFKKKTGVVTGTYTSDQILASPRSTSILSILAGQTINVSMLYGASIDNMLDINCDNIGDIIIGEPMSTAVPLIGADVVGGATYVYLGKSDGTYETAPVWDLWTDVAPLLGVNTTALIGFSVAGAGHVRGQAEGVRSLVGDPSNCLDFGVGLLNMGNTMGTLMDFTFDNNGLGKSYSFANSTCSISTLPVKLIKFTGVAVNKTVVLNWQSEAEDNLSHYELQRSSNGINYETIAIVFAKGQQSNAYNHTDLQPFIKSNYYRLKMVDTDAKFLYSNIITVRFDEEASHNITITPNPVQENINIRMNDMARGVYKLELQNITGQTLHVRTFQINQSSQTETIPRNNLPAGMYWLNISDNTNKKIKVLKVLIK